LLLLSGVGREGQDEGTAHRPRCAFYVLIAGHYSYTASQKEGNEGYKEEKKGKQGRNDGKNCGCLEVSIYFSVLWQ
jgi:hypothetical protein